MWLMNFAARPEANARLICIPHAGGGASSFKDWSHGIDPRIEVHVVQLPGRENRMIEEPLQNMESIVEPLLQALSPLRDKPLAIFGHSLGAKIGFELCHGFNAKGWRNPNYLFVSGAPAPHLARRHEEISSLSSEAFAERLRNLGATPSEVLDNQDLRDLIFPMLRADFRIVEQYVSEDDRVLKDIPTALFGGDNDPVVSVEDLRSWNTLTNVQHEEIFVGDHFFIKPHGDKILSDIASTLLNSVESPVKF